MGKRTQAVLDDHRKKRPYRPRRGSLVARHYVPPWSLHKKILVGLFVGIPLLVIIFLFYERERRINNYWKEWEARIDRRYEESLSPEERRIRRLAREEAERIVNGH